VQGYANICCLVEGTRISQVEAKLVKDGKALPLKEVEIIVMDEKVTIKFKKPVRNLSGPYKIKLSNSQGEDSRDIKINMQGTPGASTDFTSLTADSLNFLFFHLDLAALGGI
jgi:hypothetical protein